TALSAEFTIGEGELMAHDVPLGCAPDEYDDLISGTCSHLPYLFDIKDISDGGCALMTKTPNLKFLSHNALLKNAVLMLAEYGEITIDLVVKNVIVITLDNANEESESYYQISCQFKFRHLDDQRRIEKILLDLILEAKRKKRI
ncbi:hypothetical protein ACP8GV_29155, partial [Klebsiella pneumoniae]